MTSSHLDPVAVREARLATDRDCPSCGAVAGVPCKDLTGQAVGAEVFYVLPHRARREAPVPAAPDTRWPWAIGAEPEEKNDVR